MYRAAKLFPIEVRRRVAEKYGPFDRAKSEELLTIKVCANGFCIMGALANEAGLVLMQQHETPAEDDLSQALVRNRMRPEGMNGFELRRILRAAMRANDKGRLGTREAVLRFLGLREGK